jgi:D,D-heptose 1,7-bisphosphate phosphatase
MQAVILAGGRGIRLGDVTRNIPKSMMKVGNKPLLQHQIELLVRYNIKDIVILVNYLKDSIITYFGNGNQFKARISYYEEPVPLGTAGGIREIEERLTGDFIIIYGDIMINMDLSRLISYHLQKESRCTLVLHPNDHPYDSDLVEIDSESRVNAIHSKPHDPAFLYHNLVNAGVYVFSSKVLEFLEKGKKADFGREIFPKLFSKIAMFGYHSSEYLKDMGTPDRLQDVRTDFENGKINRRSFEFKQKAIFLDRDGVLNIERSYISTPDALELYNFTPAAIRMINKSDYLAIVVTNQSAVARNLCTEEDVLNIHRKLETMLGKERAWLDAIYYCPHHPDKGYPGENPVYKIDCECRKPKTGMFRKAVSQFNIDLHESYMIGDSERDIQAGINAGCITIGVRTGYGIKNTNMSPDYLFGNLAEAVDFIVKDPYYNIFKEIYNRFGNYNGKSPWIILIGGNSRTGKSTLASYLRLAFRKKGHHVLEVKLDNWIIPEEQRSNSMNVYDRFRLSIIEKDIKRLLSDETIHLTTYANHPLKQTLPVEYNSRSIDILIIEGVVALSSADMRNSAHLKIYTTIPDNVFRSRVYEYYSWRGKTTEEINTLVEKRKVDEYQLIEKESNLADLIINHPVT